MSAIAGMLRRDGAPVARSDLERMLHSMAHRGPDGWAIWRDGPIGLGYRKLASTPQSLHETGPLTGSGFTLTADARLDNRGEIAGQLEIGHDVLGTMSDTALITRVFQDRGRDGLFELAGDFAVAVWVAAERRLILARDHMGMRPIVYYASERLLAFASDVRALLVLDAVPARVDEGRVADYIVGWLEGLDKTSTFFESIVKLPPAHTLEVNADRLTVARYWSLDPGDVTRLGSNDEYAEAFREQFRRAVRCRLRSVTAPAVTLSGGVDSSAIVAFAREVGPEVGLPVIDTLSAVSPPCSERCEESWHIRTVQRQGGTCAHDLDCTELGPLLSSIRTLYDTADDLFDFEMNLPHCLYALAHSDGRNVVLDGIDGDLVASSAGHIPFLLRRGQWATALGAARGYSRFYEGDPPTHRVLVGAAKTAFVPNWMRRLRHRPGSPIPPLSWIGDSFIAPSLARRVSLTDRARALWRSRAPERAVSERHDHARTLDQPGAGFRGSAAASPVALDRGEQIAVEMDARLVGSGYVFRWRTETARIRFDQSTFHSIPLAVAELERRSPSHIPQLGARGIAVREALSLMSDGRSNDEIARCLCKHNPEAFASPVDALQLVGKLAHEYGR